jgi:hypothetical protein
VKSSLLSRLHVITGYRCGKLEIGNGIPYLFASIGLIGTIWEIRKKEIVPVSDRTHESDRYAGLIRIS